MSQDLQRTSPIILLLDGLDKQHHCINEYAVPLISHDTGPRGMCELSLGVVDVPSSHPQEVMGQVVLLLMAFFVDRIRSAKKVVVFVLDGASNLLRVVPQRDKHLMCPP